MAEKTWNELTVDQRTYLDTLARAGGGWVTSSGKIEGIRPSEYWELQRDGFVDIEDMPDTMFWVKERITAKGLLVWQQGQTPAEPDELAAEDIRHAIVAYAAMCKTIHRYVKDNDIFGVDASTVDVVLINDHRRLRGQVAALTAERDALVNAAQAVIEDCEAVRVEPIHLQALRAVAYRVSNE